MALQDTLWVQTAVLWGRDRAGLQMRVKVTGWRVELKEAQPLAKQPSSHSLPDAAAPQRGAVLTGPCDKACSHQRQQHCQASPGLRTLESTSHGRGPLLTMCSTRGQP